MRRTFAIALLVFLCTDIAMSQSVTFTQVNDSTTVTNFIWCPAGGENGEFSLLRSFDPAAEGLGCSGSITQVSFGIWTAIAGSGSAQPVNVRIYRDPSTSSVGSRSDWIQLHSETFQQSDVNQVVVTKTLSASVHIERDWRVIVEVGTPGASGAGHELRLGGNVLGQTDTAYLGACGNVQASPPPTSNFGPESWIIEAVVTPDPMLTFTQMNDSNLVNFHFFCGGTFHASFSTVRSYDPAAQGLVGAGLICGVDFAVGTVSGVGGSQPVEIRIYRDPSTGSVGTTADWVLLHTEAFQQSDASFGVIHRELSTPVSIRDNWRVIVEVWVPDGIAPGNVFLIGANSLGQTADSYVIAPACGVNTPTPWTNFNANANVIIDLDVTPAIDWPGSSDDVRMTTAVGTAGASTSFDIVDDVKTASAGDVMTIAYDSPTGTFNWSPPIVLADVFPTGTDRVGGELFGFPEIQVDIAGLFVLLDGTVPTPIGPALQIPPGGASHSYLVPNGLGGNSILLQTMVISSANTNNGIFAVSDGVEVRF